MKRIITRKGFTLVELLAVVLILGALSAIAIPRVVASADSAKQRACQTNIKIINSQTELYKALTGGYPSTLSVMTGNKDYFPDGIPVCELKGKYSLNTLHRALCSHSGAVIIKPPIVSPYR